MKLPRLSPISKLFLAATAAFLLVGVIFLISPKLASGDSGGCQADTPGLRGIVEEASPVDLPPLTFDAPDGRKVRLADYRGHGVVLNFWATWCAPCVKELPELDALKPKIAADRITVLAVSMDRGGLPTIQKFFERTGIRNLEPLHDAGNSAARALGIRGLPTTLFIDRDGKVAARITGMHHYATAETEAFLQRCIGGR